MLLADTGYVRADTDYFRAGDDAMTAIVVTLTNVCSGGNHLTFNVTGDVSLTRTIDIAEILDPISDEEKRISLSVIGKMAKNGRTIGQARTLLQTGVTVTV